MSPDPRRHYASQAQACAETVSRVLGETFGQGIPADRSLAAILRANRQYGGRDRRLFSETTFALLRWWGWLRHLVPAEHAADPERWAAQAKPRDLGRLLLGAHLLDTISLPPVCSFWASWGNLRLPRLEKLPPDPNPEARVRRLRQVFYHEDIPRLKQNDLLPQWVWPEMNQPGTGAELMAWLQRRPPLWLRAQTDNINALIASLDRDGIAVEKHPFLANALRTLPTSVNLRTLSVFKSGLFEVQDLASQAVALVCAPASGERWWDACAGAGGKSLHLAWLMCRKGSIVASDRDSRKLEELRLRARRAGYPNIRCRDWKGGPVPAKRAGFDGVLVDAPCSCSGTWRRNPDGRWRLSPGDIDEFVNRQNQLLQHASGAVRPGGSLVYATCSMFTRENSGVVDTFLAANREFEKVPFQNPLDGVSVSGMLQIWPTDGDCDAMFVAKMWRREA